jgi:hypothetical protein
MKNKNVYKLPQKALSSKKGSLRLGPLRKIKNYSSCTISIPKNGAPSPK